MANLTEVRSEEGYQVAIQLFQEYAEDLGIDLSFQSFDKEIASIRKQYARPEGALFVVYDEGNKPIGCFGIRLFVSGICELKRMYLKKSARGKGIGRQLLDKAIEVAKELNYSSIRLDTLPTMTAAIRLYKHLGFEEIEPYRYNPIEGTKYFEKQL